MRRLFEVYGTADFLQRAAAELKGPMMARRRIAFAMLTACVAAAVVYARMEARSETGIFAVDPPTPYVHYLPEGPSKGRVLVAHGLNATKDVMSLLSMALADSGFEVYAIDLPGHGDSTVGFDGLRASRALSQTVDLLEAQRGRLALVGHSFSGALVLDLANERDFGDVVIIATAPTPVDRIRALRVLDISGSFDIPRAREFAESLQSEPTLSGGHVEFYSIEWAGHTGPIFRPDVQKKIAAWLGGNASNIHTTARLVLLMTMGALSLMAGFLLLVRHGATPGASVLIPSEHSSFGVEMFRYAAAAAGAVLACAAFPQISSAFGVLGLGYLFAFLFFMGALLFAIPGRARFSGSTAGTLVAVLAAAYLLAIPGAAVAGKLTHLAWSGGRLWRLPLMAVAALPFFLADELSLGLINPRWKAGLLALLTRLVMTAAVVTGVLSFNREASVLLLLAIPFTGLWIGLWVAAEPVRQRTRSPFAAALFAALIQASILSAVAILV